MIGLAATAAILLAPMSARFPAPAISEAPAAHRDALSVTIQASGTHDVSYAIEVHNTTDHAVADAVITQQLPAGLDYVTATPPPHRTGRRLIWTLTIPAHGTVHITTTTADTTGHHLAARPLDHVTQADALDSDHHRQRTTTVCAREGTGPQACATERGALRPEALSRWQRAALALTGTAAVTAALLGGARVWRRRRAAGSLERAGVEG